MHIIYINLYNYAFNIYNFNKIITKTFFYSITV